jgi:hypothetical protein
LKVSFFFGRNKIPFELRGCRIAESESIPFNGIISRGLLNKFIKYSLDIQIWQKYAHFLFKNGDYPVSNEYNILKKLSQECKVLSFGQSALSAQTYAEYYCKSLKKTDCLIELWNIKEGHTSTVWKVTVKTPEFEDIFVVNVSRDLEAGVELKETSEKLMIIAGMYPDLNLAKVLDIYSLSENFLPSEVIITKNEWVDNSFEVHSRRNLRSKHEELIMVEQFLTHRNDPAFITSVIGRVFSQYESEKIFSQINHFLKMGAACLPGGLRVDINHGDVVWNGERAIVIAIS